MTTEPPGRSNVPKLVRRLQQLSEGARRIFELGESIAMDMRDYKAMGDAMHEAAEVLSDLTDTRDARRYRWLRDPQNADEARLPLTLWGENMDAAIDAAIASVPYPQFCHHPDKCAGLSNCPRDPNCCD